MKLLHFCGGLPRTGSTVLMNILQQNPEIFTTSSDPYPEILQHEILSKSRLKTKFQAMSCKQADDAMYGLIQGGTKGWYKGLTDKPVVISKSREWTSLHHLFPDSKHIIMIRDLRDVVESFDRVNQKIKALHTYDNQNIPYASMADEEKYKYFFETKNVLSDALWLGVAKYLKLFDRDRFKFVRYEDFVQAPEYMLERIYSFLGVDFYQHDLYNIEQSAMFEHDHAYFRERTDHTVKPQMIEWSEPVRTLSESVHKTIINDHMWYYKAFYPEVLE